MNIYIAGDKHGFKVIGIVRVWLETKGYAYTNLGVDNTEDNIALEVMLPEVADAVRNSTEKSFGIVSCGTGIGTEVGINKFSGIRASLITDPELAKWAREKDNCNVLCLVGWRVDEENIHAILENWFNTNYDGSENRLEMMKEFDKWH